MTGGNDISLIYPWVNINDCTTDICSWIGKEEERLERQFGEELGSLENSLVGSEEQTSNEAKHHRKLSQVTKLD